MMKYNIIRNPIIEVSDDFHIQTIGDPHLGREFRNNVFSHRRGEREQQVWNTFTTLLKPKSSKVKIIKIVGDLFDTFSVKSDITLKAFEILKNAVENNPNVEYIIIPGNHDLSKDVTKVSTYQIFYTLVNLLNLNNLHCILEEHKIIRYEEVAILCCAYNPFENTELDLKYITELESIDTPIITVGHFDGFEINGKGYTPTPKMKELSNLIVSGHEHTYKELQLDSVSILFTGSMQPYSHAEDPMSDYYITLDCDILDDLDLSTLKNKFVRILRDSDFELKESFDCMSLTYQLKEQDTTKEEIDLATIVENTKSSITYTEKVLLAVNEIETEENIKDKYLNFIASKSYIK